MIDVFDLKTILEAVKDPTQPHAGYIVIVHPSWRRQWLLDAVRARSYLARHIERTRARIMRGEHAWLPLEDPYGEEELDALDAEIRWLRVEPKEVDDEPLP